MNLSFREAIITIKGRIIESIDPVEKELLQVVPTISLGSVVRTDKFLEGLLVNSINVEKEEEFKNVC